MNKPPTTSPVKHGVIFCFSLLLTLILSISALAWTDYQNNAQNTGYYSEYTTSWVQASKVFTEKTDGSAFQPLIIDVDNDGTKELIASDGNYLKLYTMTAGILTLKDDYNFGEAQQAMITAIDYDNDNYTELFYAHNNNITIIEYNTTDFVTGQSFSVSGTLASPPLCINTTHSSQITCLWTNNNGNLTETTLNASGEFPSPTTYNLSEADIFTTAKGLKQTPPIKDIDNDGADEIVWPCDYDNNGAEGLCVTDVSSLSAFDTYFSSDGVLDDLDTDSSQIGGIVVYDLETGGDYEIIVTYVATSGAVNQQDAFMKIIGASGSLEHTETIIDEGGSTETTKISPPVVADFINTILTDEEDVCVVAVQISSTTNDKTTIYCMDDGYNDVFGYSTSLAEGNHLLYWVDGATIAGADLIDDTAGKVELIVGGAILDLDATLVDEIESHINFTTLSTTEASSSIAIGDLNNDLAGDVCGQRSGNIFCSYYAVTNSAPTLRDINIDTGNPICLGQTITFSAREGQDYTNDLTNDEERIAMKFSNGTFVYGSYSASSPTLDYLTTQITQYSVTLYLQDKQNSADLTQYTEYQFYVSNSTLTCNLKGQNPQESTIYTNTTESVDVGDEIDTAFDDSGLSLGTNGKILVIFIVLIYVLYSILSAGHTGIALFASITIGFVATIVIGYAIGWIPKWILLTCGLIAIAMIVYSIFNGRGGS